jgi:hypothetical protein
MWQTAQFEHSSLRQRTYQKVRNKTSVLALIFFSFKLIERLSKLVRNECLYSKYYEKFNSFKKAISDCLKTAHIGKKQKLAKLLIWNYQSFKNVKFLTI